MQDGLKDLRRLSAAWDEHDLEATASRLGLIQRMCPLSGRSPREFAMTESFALQALRVRRQQTKARRPKTMVGHDVYRMRAASEAALGQQQVGFGQQG